MCDSRDSLGLGKWTSIGECIVNPLDVGYCMQRGIKVTMAAGSVFLP